VFLVLVVHVPVQVNSPQNRPKQTLACEIVIDTPCLLKEETTVARECSAVPTELTAQIHFRILVFLVLVVHVPVQVNRGREWDII
jgi:hypothetical protein